MTYEEAERLLLETHKRDPEATRWLLDNYGDNLKNHSNISHMFHWGESPQGSDFWCTIANITCPGWNGR